MFSLFKRLCFSLLASDSFIMTNPSAYDHPETFKRCARVTLSACMIVIVKETLFSNFQVKYLL